MYYKFGDGARENIGREIDCKSIHQKLMKKYPDIPNENFAKELKKMIKSEKIFLSHVDEFGLTIKEYINILIYIFPDMWNHHLIKYVKQNYLEKEKSDFEKL